MREIIVDKKYDNKKLNTFLLDSFNGLTLNTFYKTLRKKDVRVNNTKVSDNIFLHEHDIISIYLSDEFLFKNVNIDIVYEDNNILVANKPINIEVVSSKPNEKSLTSILNKGNNFPLPCHRLDRNTSGLVLFAKNQECLNTLVDKFKSQEIEKHYLCTVYGCPKKEEDTLVSYLFKDSKKSLVYISDVQKKGYREIITSYKLIKKNDDNTSLLDVTLHTRKNSSNKSSSCSYRFTNNR